MAAFQVPSHDELQQHLIKAVKKMAAGESKPVLVFSNLLLSVAEAFADANEDTKGLFFCKTGERNGESVGDLCLFYDPMCSRPATRAAWCLCDWMWPWNSTVMSSAIGTCGLLAVGGMARVMMHGGFREPASSLYLYGATHPNATIEVSRLQSREDLEDVMAQWVAPGGPARVAIGVKVESGTQPGVAPRVEVLMQLEGELRPSVVVSCGAGSGCRSPAMFDHTLFVPLDKLLYGAPWLVRLLVSLQLAVQVPVFSAVVGGFCAARDVLRGTRSLLGVASASARSLFGPWWGVVPLDAFWIRYAVFWGMRLQQLATSA